MQSKTGKNNMLPDFLKDISDKKQYTILPKFYDIDEILVSEQQIRTLQWKLESNQSLDPEDKEMLDMALSHVFIKGKINADRS